MLRLNLTTTENTTMEISIRALRLPCKLVLDDYQGFLSEAKKQGEDNYQMAQKIADLGFVRVYGVGDSADGIPLLNTGVQFKGQSIGLSESELKYFTAHPAEF